MPSERARLITHPVRSRILAAFLGRQLTVQQLGVLLPDLPLSSLYRHVRLLADGGILAAVGEVRVNGTLTRVYAVPPGQARVRPEDTRGATRAEHLGYFTGFLNTLADLHAAYLREEDAVPEEDPVHGRMGVLNLSPEEYRRFMDELQELLGRWTPVPPAAGRRRVIFAHLSVPDRDDPPQS